MKNMVPSFIGLIACFLVASVSFFVGYWWKGEQLGGLDRYEIEQAVDLQLSPERAGRLPAGTVLYEYRTLPETTTYIVFVNLKERNIIRRRGDGSEVVVEPIDAVPTAAK